MAKSQRFPISVLAVVDAPFDISVFETDCGWFGLLGQNGRLRAVRIGHARQGDVTVSIQEQFGLASTDVRQRDWQPDLMQRLRAFCTGQADDFADIDIVYQHALPPFRLAVLNALRRVKAGETVSYLELAALAGSPRAARAVGNAMATNIFPIIVPCHRVLGSGGHLGGFTAPGGLDLKQQLLRTEAEMSLTRKRR